MDPIRSTRSSSRRSSILKPAKPRQALQNLNFNSSSNESSPTTKLKRRVSFAEKKHVKEFCNSVEQGTVWDNTYEEHDLSNLKPFCAPNGKEHGAEDASKGNVEFNESCNESIYPNSETINECSIQGNNVRFASDRSIQGDLDGEDSDLDFTNIVENIQSVHELVTRKEELPNASSVLFSNTAEQMCDSDSPTDLQSTSGIRQIISVYQDPCTDIPKETSEPSHPNVHRLSYSNLNATSYQDINMDFTEVVCNVDVQDIEPEGMRKNTSIEFTQLVPTSMDISFDSQDIIFDSQYRVKKLNGAATEEMDLDMSMEATVAIPSILKSTITNDNAEVAAYSTDDRTVKFNNVSMEATVAIPSILKSAINNDNAEVAAYSTDDRTVKFNNVSMEATVAIPSIFKSAINNDNAEVTAYSTDDRTVKFSNVSMEVTSAVPTILCNAQQMNINQLENSELNSGSSDRDCRFTIFHDTSMEMTRPVKISSRKEAPCADNARRLSTIQKVPQSKNDATCVDEETMEVTKAVAVNIHSKNQGINATHCEVSAVDSNSGELRGGGNSYKKMVDFDESTACDDAAMEFTTAIGRFCKERTGNFQTDEPAKIIFYPQWSSHNSVPDDLRDDANSDRTRVFHNNSMTTTAVVSSLKARDTCEEEEIDRETEINDQEFSRTVLLPNISMEITEAVTALRNRVEMENFVDLSKVEEPMFENSRSSNLSREPLDHSSVPDNVLRDITATVVPSANSDTPSNETNCSIDNLRKLKDSCTKEPTLNEVQNSVNTRTSISLHGLIEQDTCASALEENNTPACAPFNSAPKSDIRAATSEVIQSESLRHESSQVIATHSRRTYTLKSYSTGHSFTNSNKENKISERNVDTSCYKINDKENRVHILNEIGNLQDNECYHEQSSMEKIVQMETFFGNSLEELELIKPPSFMCLDDSLCEDTPVNVSYHPEVNRETDCLANTVKRSENIEGSPKFTCDYHKCNLVQSNEVNILEEDGCNSQTFLNKQTLLESEPDNSKLAVEDQGPQNYTNADVRVLECSSSTANDIERFPLPAIAKDLVDMEMKEIGADNIEAQRMDCPLEIRNTGERARDDQILSNAMATESRESLVPGALSVENNISIELDPFSKITKELKIRAQSDEIIWDVYHESIEKRVFVIGFISCSLLVAIYLRDDCDAASVQFIKNIRIISRLADDADVLIGIVHWLILEKLDTAKLMDLYKTSEDILPILDYISKEVKLAMDFMFDVKRFEDINLMEITRDSISFVSRTKRMDIILRVTINIKPFNKIESEDISVHCLLGSVREDDIKKLIINIKRDHKFLRRFMNDVREYIYLMEESDNMIKKSY